MGESLSLALGIRPAERNSKQSFKLLTAHITPKGVVEYGRFDCVAISAPTSRDDRRCSFDELLVAAREGEDWAFRSLFDALSSPIAAFVRSRIGSDVDDIVNEIFLAAFNGIDKFEGSVSEYRAWVFGIARNKINDSHRRSYRSVDQAELDIESHAQRSVEAELEFADQEQRERVEEMLESLTPDQRDVILLRVLADLSIEQVASILGKPPGAIKSLQHRALEALKRNSEMAVLA